MKTVKIGIIGLGTVGEAVLKMLLRYRNLIQKRSSLKIEVVKVCDKDKNKRGITERLGVSFSEDPFSIIDNPHIDVVVELIGGIRPAYDYVIFALRKKKHIVTANKALLAQYGAEIFSLAEKKKVNIGFEASVCGAIPLLRSIKEGLIGCEIKKIYGILNGTTNYILYRMSEDSLEFREVLKEAQKKGFAEKDPSLDIKGVDTLHKLCILSYLCFGIWPDQSKIYTQGIQNISSLDILYAGELFYSIKLMAMARREKEGLFLRVSPALIRKTHPLSQVGSSFNAVWLDTYPAGELLFYGRGAGGFPTSSAIISDLINVAEAPPFFPKEQKNIKLAKIENLKSRYYIRFIAQDRPGVLAKISKILASFRISIASVTQKERRKGKFVPIVMLTHEAEEKDLRKAVAGIDKLDIIRPPTQLIPIEDI
ncbi:MAG: homoserine dehydrogenase [Candidatus Omnitrophota bacterium]|nr:MAG: homoserine dehydrogenase [Candidatus Omnitrophota bacterium]